jgi:LacI family transcriptional regulator
VYSLTPVSDRDLTRIDTLKERGISVVLVDRVAARANQCAVAVDDVAGGRMGAEHLVRSGHQRVGFVGGPFKMARSRTGTTAPCSV